MARTFSKSFVAAFLAGVLVLLPGLGELSPLSAGHDDGACDWQSWDETVWENGVLTEKGVHAQIKIAGIDNMSIGTVRAIFAWHNYDNNAEVGWAYVLAKHDRQQHFWHAIDGGIPSGNDGTGYAGDKNVFKPYRIVNDSGTTWTFKADGNTIKTKTFNNLSSGDALGSSEVDGNCDSAWGHFIDLSDKDCSTCAWGQWSAIENSSVGTENPCFHTEIVSVAEFRVEHGSSGNETCP